MTNVSEIKKEEGFLVYAELEAIKKRLKILPNLEYKIEGNNIVHEGKVFVNVQYIGGLEFYKNVVSDMNRLVWHVEEAEKRNNQLDETCVKALQKIDELQDMINILTNKLKGENYEKGDWILDV